MSTNKTFLILIVCSILFNASCKVNEQDSPKISDKKITKFSLSLINTANINDNIILNSMDADGEGGSLPAIVFLKLKPNSTYDLKVIGLLNETSSPVIDYQPIISSRKEDYTIFYEKNKLDGLDLAIEEYDVDRNGKQVGLTAKLITKSVSSGNLTVKLKNQKGLKTLDSSIGVLEKSANFMITIEN